MKINSRIDNVTSFNHIEYDIEQKLLDLWKNTSSVSNLNDIPMFILWIKNIIGNLKKPKNKFSYDHHIQQFALLLLIQGGRNCYEFLRLNLYGALPHITNLELLMRNQNVKINEGQFRFDLLNEYLQSNDNKYVFSSEDSTRSICQIDYDAQSTSFIGFCLPLVTGIPQTNFFQTESLEELKVWFNTIEKSTFINLHMMQSLSPSKPPFILSAYGSSNKATAIDILQRWLYIFKQCLAQGIRIIGFSTDADARYIRAMRLCSRFFAELPNMNLLKYNIDFCIKIPEQWCWFLMKTEQVLLFMQDPIHIATKFRNRLLSTVASLKMGDFPIDNQHLFDLLESRSKLEHSLIKCDINPKDRQNFISCQRISSELVLDLLNENEDTKGTYVYLSLLPLLISGFIDKSPTIEDRLYYVWTVVFTCRLWWSWIRYVEVKCINDDSDLDSVKRIKSNCFITKPTFWCIELNAHALLYIILLVIEEKLPVNALNTYLFNSQTCENTFRTARALSGTFSTITNFTVKSFLKRCEKISIVNSIKSREDAFDNYHFQFPKHHKNHEETFDYSVETIDKLNLTKIDIEKIIKRAFESAKEYVSMVNMTHLLKKKKVYSLSDLSQFMKISLQKSSSKVIDYTEDVDSDEDDIEDQYGDEENDSETLGSDNQMSTDNIIDDAEEDGCVLATDLSEIERKNFDGCRIYDNINPQQIKKYFHIRIGTSYKYIHKQTACWLLSNSRDRPSSDRLLRVQKSTMEN
ncbi:unnamed protein product [Adineta ricciae]|uniref:Uncharacterized protein n=1 Tax=Adineta ricciae TaxID=249248 RepID=A0A814QTR8_ADIRI|nr:unnamed protein product [Adineta ricciae]